jgi:TPR repeat protein
MNDRLVLFLLLFFVPSAVAAAKTCQQGDANACFRQGYSLESKDVLKAKAAYKKACDGKVAAACVNLGLLQEKQTPPAWKDAAKSYEKACKLGHMKGCNNLGVAYENGAGVSQSFVSARTHFKQACDKKQPTACYNLGLLFSYGKGVKLHDQTALGLYRKACTLGEPRGCLYLGFSYGNGWGCKMNGKMAGRYYKLSCSRGSAEGCHSMGILHHTGMIQSVRKDLKKARQYYKSACQMEFASSCDTYAKIIISDRIPRARVLGYMNKALRLYDRDCRQSGAACLRARNLVEYVSASMKKHLTPRWKAVKATSYDKRAADLFAKGCKKNTASECGQLAKMYRRGRGVARSFPRMLALFRKGCSLHHADSCAELGKMYGYGFFGAKKDCGKARALINKACRLGDYYACRWKVCRSRW